MKTKGLQAENAIAGRLFFKSQISNLKFPKPRNAPETPPLPKLADRFPALPY
jgi:hypothetical protein